MSWILLNTSLNRIRINSAAFARVGRLLCSIRDLGSWNLSSREILMLPPCTASNMERRWPIKNENTINDVSQLTKEMLDLKNRQLRTSECCNYSTLPKTESRFGGWIWISVALHFFALAVWRGHVDSGCMCTTRVQRLLNFSKPNRKHMFPMWSFRTDWHS